MIESPRGEIEGVGGIEKGAPGDYEGHCEGIVRGL